MARKRTSENSLSSVGAVTTRRRPLGQTHATHSAIAVETPSVSAPTEEEIAQRAHSYWEARGFESGSPEQDWLRAEQELRAERGMRASSVTA